MSTSGFESVHFRIRKILRKIIKGCQTFCKNEISHSFNQDIFTNETGNLLLGFALDPKRCRSSNEKLQLNVRLTLAIKELTKFMENNEASLIDFQKYCSTAQKPQIKNTKDIENEIQIMSRKALFAMHTVRTFLDLIQTQIPVLLSTIEFLFKTYCCSMKKILGNFIQKKFTGVAEILKYDTAFSTLETSWRENIMLIINDFDDPLIGINSWISEMEKMQEYSEGSVSKEDEQIMVQNTIGVIELLYADCFVLINDICQQVIHNLKPSAEQWIKSMNDCSF